MRDHDAIMADAREGSPFSNSTMGEIWMDQWCYRCKVDAGGRMTTMQPDLPYDRPVAELHRRLAELTTLVHLYQLLETTGLADLDNMLRLKRGSRR